MAKYKMAKYKIEKREFPGDSEYPDYALFVKSWFRWRFHSSYRSFIDAKLAMKSLVYKSPCVTEQSYYFENGVEDIGW